MKLCGFDVGLEHPFFLIAGPCVIESMQLQLDVAGQLKEITGRLGIPFIFKSSFDKANRTSGTSFRGPGLEEGRPSGPLSFSGRHSRRRGDDGPARDRMDAVEGQYLVLGPP